MDSDFSAGYSRLRAQINQDTAGAYSEFVRGLKPDLRMVWRDIALGYLAIAAVLWLAQLPATPLGLALAIPLCAAATGYAVAYLQLFIHEAAHYNLAPTRGANDRLADAFLSWHIGTSAKAYRPVHFQHHQALGETHDTETSYFHALTGAFFVEMLTGVHALRTANSRGGRRWLPLALGVAVHAIVCGALVAAGAWPSAVAWVLGMAVFFPFFAALRQVLEHRSASAAAGSDFRKVPHGAVTRLFGDGIVASTFGGAGFNRHLLHHWEPQVSYTRLRELEGFLLRTRAAPILESRRTTYARVLRELIRSDNARR